MSTQEQTQTRSHWDEIKKEGLSLLSALGKAIDQTAQDLSKITVLSLEMDEREKLDKLVKAGIFNSRSDALRYLINEGARTRKDLFDKIDLTDNEIQNLKQNLLQTFASKQME